MRALILRYRKYIEIIGFVLFVFSFVCFFVCLRNYLAAKAWDDTVHEEREKRKATIDEMNETLRGLTDAMNRVTSSLPGGGVPPTTELTLMVEPYAGWDKWYPWSDWQGTEPLPDLFKVDMSDPAIDFDRFEKIYLSSKLATRLSCLDEMVLFDITHPDMDSSRREVVRRTFKNLMAHDHQYIVEMCCRLPYNLLSGCISLENLFAYAEILAPMVDATDEAKGREEIRSSFHLHYGYLQLQLEKILDEDKRNDMLLVVKKWCPDFTFQQNEKNSN